MHQYITTRRLAWWLAALVIVGGLIAAAIFGPLTFARSALAQANTVITVDASPDLESGSLRYTCTYTQGAIFTPAPDNKCTLRRAINEAAARPQSDRPIVIQFNLPANDPGKDLEVSGTWTLQVDAALPPLKTDTVLNINGQVLIDGGTQPGGRSDGPPIIIDTNDHSLEVESTGNIIRNLAFKGGGVIFLKEDGNTVENIWMGLSDDGQSIVFRDTSDYKRMAGGGVFISSDNNTVQDNTISGAYAKAIDINSGSDNNLITRNQIGTRADGTVPSVPEAIQCLRSFNYDPANWYGGWGIAIAGSNNEVSRNRIAGLHIMQAQNDSPPTAIEIFGADHTVTQNIIGVAKGGDLVGVCGQGIKVSGSGTQIVDNAVVRSRTGFEGNDGKALDMAILASDTSPLFGQITVRGNVVVDGPGRVYGFGPGIPDTLKLFEPARITNIDGVTVSGGNGENSPCPNCLIDIYLDDDDETAETLEHLGAATADANGDFTFTLSQPLSAGDGLRTNSTTQSGGVIGNYLAGTTTKTSKLFLPMTDLSIDGPTAGQPGVQHQFQIEVSPAGATTPYTYTVDATDMNTQSLTTENNIVVATYAWVTDGTKTIKVTVANDLGTVTATHQIEISGSGSGTPTPTPAPTGTPGPTPTPSPTSTPSGSSNPSVYLPLVAR
jgi:hypothetical protein